MDQNWIPVDFETAEIKTSESGGNILAVRGRCQGTDVKLFPVDYLALPEYWRIDVLADSSGENSLSNYEVSLKLDGICGSKGVEVFGRETSVKIDIDN